MTVLVVVLAVVLVVLVAFVAVRERTRGKPKHATPSPGRVVFPLIGSALSQRGLDAALRLARVDGATLVPVYLAQVPLHLPLETALPVQCHAAIPLLEAIEQRAVRSGVAVDSRIERGRSYRHALRELLAHEQFDTVVVTAADGSGVGLAPEDIEWMLENVPGEIIVIRPGTADLESYLMSGGRPPLKRRPTRARDGRGEGLLPRLRLLTGGAREAT